MMAGLELVFRVAAVVVIVAEGPKVVDADPHSTEELGKPLSLGIGHLDVVAVAVLFL
jgi:hypothetical protein